MSTNGIQEKSFSFADPDKVRNILSQYPDKQSALLPLLHLAQSEEGHISSAVVDTISEIVDCHQALVLSLIHI